MGTLIGVVVAAIVGSVLAIAASATFSAIAGQDPKPPGQVQNDIPVYGKR